MFLPTSFLVQLENYFGRRKENRNRNGIHLCHVSGKVEILVQQKVGKHLGCVSHFWYNTIHAFLGFNIMYTVRFIGQLAYEMQRLLCMEDVTMKVCSQLMRLWMSISIMELLGTMFVCWKWWLGILLWVANNDIITQTGTGAANKTICSSASLIDCRAAQRLSSVILWPDPDRVVISQLGRRKWNAVMLSTTWEDHKLHGAFCSVEWYCAADLMLKCWEHGN